MKLNIFQQTMFRLLCVLFCLTAAAQVQAQSVDFSIRLTPGGEYQVFFRPDFTLGAPLDQISTSQVTIVAPAAVGPLVPLAAEAPVNPAWGQVTAVFCGWSVNARTDTPIENPAADYISVGMTPGCLGANWTSGVEIHMFSFTLGACDGPLELIVNATDPFNVLPNSVNSNPGNEITVLGPVGASATYGVNYDTGMADCSATLLPDAIDDTDSTVEDIPVTTSVLTNDDQGDAPATITGNTQGGSGSVTCTTTDCTYTPNLAFVGVDTYTYTITDSDGDMDTATVTVTVTDEGAPTAMDDMNSTGEDVPIVGAATVFANDMLTDDATLFGFDAVSTGGGTVSMNPDGTYDYTPATGFNGVDTFTYTICDDDTPAAECAVATVTITVAAAGSPLAVDDSLSTTEDVPVAGCSLFDNDTLADGATLDSFDAAGTSGGVVVVNADGTCSYTPPPAFDGTDTFTYTICDNDIPPECSTATVTVTIADEGAPAAVDDSGFGLPNNDIMGSAFDNDSLVDDATLDTFDAVGTAGGTVVMNPDGTFTYTPPVDFLGTDTFTYTICDDDLVPQCSTATVTLRIAIPPTGPVPTLSQWGAMLLVLALLMLAYRRFNPPLRRMS